MSDVLSLDPCALLSPAAFWRTLVFLDEGFRWLPELNENLSEEFLTLFFFAPGPAVHVLMKDTGLTSDTDPLGFLVAMQGSTDCALLLVVSYY